MDLPSLAGGVLVGASGAGVSALAVWALSEVRRLTRRLDALEAERKTATPEARRIDAVADAWSAVRLLELGLSDSLDGLVRINPEAAKAVVRRVAPHLFGDKVG